MEFDDRCVMVTGASGNLGRAVERVFAARGATLVLVGSRAEPLRRAFGDGDARRMLAPVNLLDTAGVAATVGAALARFGRIDVLCNLAGGFRMGPRAHDTGDDDWNAMFDLNVRTLLHASAAVVPGMIAAGGGRIVNVGAFAAQKGVARMGAYVAAKAAVIRITETMSAELRDAAINVNCVLPTIIDTPENRAAMPDADPARWVAPGDLANVIAYLASDTARAVHGAALPVTGLG
ncbi:MAG: SDR family NAD(P)-dependent oxidoreductase [Gammaproteobacteria bacterium]|nr:SDR family NAD(P)-dependent oxidoreductase [Gammaproteobacteria bacterium]